jgi:transcription antitermination factor NusG
MSSSSAWQQPTTSPVMGDDFSRWYAIHTRSRHEKAVASRLEEQGLTTFVPTITEVRRWSDRRKLVEFPLFSCYAFVNLSWRSELRAKVVRTDGVLGFVSFGNGAVPIPDVEIENVRTLLTGMVPCTAYPFLKLGQRVRIRGGALDGVEGIFLARKGNKTLVISIEPIQRSLAINIDGYAVEPL